MLTAESLEVNACRARTFDVCKSVVALIIAKGGNPAVEDKNILAGQEFALGVTRRRGMTHYACRILACDAPNHIAFRLTNRSHLATVEFRTCDSESSDGSVTLLLAKCEVEIVSPLARLATPLIAWQLRRQFRHQAAMLKAIAESDTGLPVPEASRRGLWHRPQSHYKGLLEACSPGMHQAAADLLRRHVTPRGAVLDLGAGTGAWMSRLHDAGYRDFTAVELNVDAFGFSGVEPLPLDLNEPFAEAFQSRFELITALEIVEHLDSPRHFLRQIHRLLADDGHLVLTMPNVGQWAGRLRFLMRGEHIFFEEPDFDQRHISPVTDLHMSLMFSEVGFRLIEKISAGSFDGPLKRVAVAPLATAFRILLGSRTQGDVSIYLVAKDAPDVASFGRDSHYNRRTSRMLVASLRESKQVPR